jgi:uncharacterized protein YacL
VRLALRLFGFAIGVLLGWQFGSLLTWSSDSNDAATRSILFVMAIAVGGIGYLLGPHISWAVVRNVRQAVRRASVVDLVAIGVGLAFGGVVSALLALPLAALPDPLGSTLPLLVTVVVCAFSILIVQWRKRDLIAPWLGGGSPPAAEPLVPPTPSVLLDTSVIIDGRIADLARTGFLDAPLIVPRFVLDELQFIADAADPQRRSRGRRGLETLNRLRQEAAITVQIDDADFPDLREVDGKLVRLATQRGWRILTNDFNLGRVAELQGVRVLNLNALAAAVRPPVTPGEELHLRVVQEGREPGQGVGYLDDGTMVVVDGGRSLVGQETSVTVTRLLPTGAGRLVFAVPKHAPASAH